MVEKQSGSDQLIEQPDGKAAFYSDPRHCREDSMTSKIRRGLPALFTIVLLATVTFGQD